MSWQIRAIAMSFFCIHDTTIQGKAIIGIIRSALEFDRNIRPTDMTDSLQAASGALLSAADTVKSGENVR